MKHIFTFFVCWGLTILIAQNNAYYVSNQVLVKYKSAEAYQKSAILRSNLEVRKINAIPALQVELWELPKSCEMGTDCLREVKEWADYLKKNESNLAIVQPNYIYGAGSLPPNDTAFYKQWYLQNTGWNGCTSGIDIAALAAWDIRRNAKYARVGIFDTGIDWKHPDLVDNIWRNLGEDADHDSTTIVWDNATQQWKLDPGDLNGIDDDQNGYVDDVIGWDFVNNDNNPMDDNGHGTHVSGIIGAKANNNIGIAGIAGAGIQMMALKCLDESGSGYSFSILLALQYSINKGAMVTNHSYGGGAYDPVMFNYINTNCKQAGQLLVAAAGNNHVNNDTDPMYPASYDSDIIISVGSHDCSGNPSAFSNFGSNSVDIFAPGDAIYSTDLNGQYSFRSGTSMAAPMVTAAAVLVKSYYPSLLPIQIKNTLLNAVTKSTTLNYCVAKGFLNLYKALRNRSYENGVLPMNTESFFDPNMVGISPIRKNIVVTEKGIEFWGTSENSADPLKYMFSTNNYTFKDTTYFGLGGNYTPTTWQAPQLIAPDSTEKAWALFTNGIFAKYDGEKWKRYSLPTTLIGNASITGMVVGKSHHLWISTSTNGLLRFDGQAWTPYNTTLGNCPVNDITYMVVDNNKNLWLTDNNLLVKYDGNTWISNLIPNTSGGCIKKILPDKNGKKWLLCCCGDVLAYNDTSWSFWANINPCTWTTGVLDNICLNNQGDVILAKFCGGSTSVAIEINNADTLAYTDFNPFFWTSSLFWDKSNHLWSLSSDSYVYYLFAQDINQLLSFYEYLPNYNWSIANNTKDIAHNTWVIWDEYIYKITNKDSINYLGINALREGWLGNPEAVPAIIQKDMYHNTWVGKTPYTSFNDNSLGRFSQDGCYYPYNKYNFILSLNRVNCIETYQEKVYVGTDAGLAIYNHSDSSWLGYTTNNILPDNNVTCVAIDSSEQLWIGTDKGMVHWNGVTATLYDSLSYPQLVSNHVKCLTIDKLQRKWLATKKGLTLYTGTTWANYDTANSDLPDNNINCLLVDTRNHIWVGTNNGIAEFDGLTWAIYNTSNTNLTSNQILCMAIDSAGNKWVGTSVDGLVLFFDKLVRFTPSSFTTCLNSSLTFTNQTTEADSFTWKVNNNIVSNDTNLTYTFTAAGVHRVELIAHKGTLDKSFFQYITVRTPIQVNLGNDTTLCHSSFEISTEVAAEKYKWKTPAGVLLDPDSTNESFTVSGAGTHTVVLEATDYCGAVSSDVITVTLAGDCVLPGDVNADGAVDMADFIALQPLFGQTGTPRPSASSQPVYQVCPDWGSNQPTPYTSVNKKHADCDGNGIINLADAEIIKQNATGLMKRQGATDSTVYEMYLERVNYNPYQWFYPDDTIWHYVRLVKENGQPINNVNRFSFNGRYNLNIIDEPTWQLNNSFMGVVGTNLFGKVIRKGKSVDIGLLRTIGFGSNAGNSVVGMLATNPRRIKSDTNHVVHSIFLTVTTNNGVVTLNNGTRVKVHTQGSHNTQTMEIRLPWNRLNLHLNLQGAYNPATQMMRNDLQAANVLPSINPYPEIAPFKPISLPPNVVDWVEVQLRKASDVTETGIVEKRAGLLLTDGSIISPYAEDSGKIYLLAQAGNYHIVVKHRNHLAVISPNAVYLSGNLSQTTTYDFTNQAAGQIAVGNGKYAMFAGDVNQDKTLSYMGLNNDREMILNKLASPLDKTKTLTGYFREDVNLDGKVQYTGNGNDRAIILRNIGGSTVNNTVQSLVQ